MRVWVSTSRRSPPEILILDWGGTDGSRYTTPRPKVPYPVIWAIHVPRRTVGATSRQRENGSWKAELPVSKRTPIPSRRDYPVKLLSTVEGTTRMHTSSWQDRWHEACTCIGCLFRATLRAFMPRWNANTVTSYA